MRSLLLCLLIFTTASWITRPASGDEPSGNPLIDPEEAQDTATAYLHNRIDPNTELTLSTPAVNAELREAQLRPDTGLSNAATAAAGFGMPP